MRVNTCETSMVFIDLTQDELNRLKQMMPERDMLHEQKGVRVYGTPEQLYKILHRLSFTYDIEL